MRTITLSRFEVEDAVVRRVYNLVRPVVAYVQFHGGYTQWLATNSWFPAFNGRGMSAADCIISFVTKFDLWYRNDYRDSINELTSSRIRDLVKSVAIFPIVKAEK